MSLKAKLLDTLKLNGQINLNELQVLCNSYPAKVSTAEKRLREFREPLHKDYHPQVQIEEKNGYINVYKWSETPNSAPRATINPTGACCYSSTVFFDRKTGLPIHSRECVNK